MSHAIIMCHLVFLSVLVLCTQNETGSEEEK